MKTERLIVNYDSEKLRAIRLFAPEGSLNIEAQVIEQLDKVYQRIVPQPARMFIEDSANAKSTGDGNRKS